MSLFDAYLSVDKSNFEGGLQLDLGLEVEEGTLYPLIRRLEKQGLLNSEWREENKRRKRFYQLSDLGELAYARLLSDWRDMNTRIEQIVLG